MLILLAPFVVLAAAVAWAAGLRRGAAVGGAVVIALLLLGSVLGGFLDPEAEERDAVVDTDDDPVDSASELEPVEIEPRVRTTDVVFVPPAAPFATPEGLSGLHDGDVRMVGVAVEGFVTLHQCEAGAIDADRCAAGVVAIAVDQSPTALVELRTQIATQTGRVDCIESACVLAAFDGPEPILAVPLTFGGPPRPQPDVTVVPLTEVHAGQDLSVTVRGLAPGAGGRVAFCAAAEGASTARCRDDAAVDLSPVDSSGEATATLRLAACPPTDRSAVRVAVGGAPLTYAEISFATPPGPDLDDGQLIGGLAAAGALFAAALVLLRRTDWTEPDGDPFADVDVGHDDPFVGIDLSVDEWGQPWT